MDETQTMSMLVEQQGRLDFTMSVGGTAYPVESFRVEHAQTPVTKPTMRGGVYFSNLKEFKIQAGFLGTALLPSLSKTMLGPNTDFENIKFLTRMEIGGAKKQLAVIANLTNYVQRGDNLELNLIVVGTELSD
jgi:hypothetical protein